jgi:hypothetical protein
MKATIDRIEGDIAVLILRDNEMLRVNVPVSLLPADSREGDIVTITIERDAAATLLAHERVTGLIERLKQP